jgi:hypothetical protein
MKSSSGIFKEAGAGQRENLKSNLKFNRPDLENPGGVGRKEDISGHQAFKRPDLLNRAKSGGAGRKEDISGHQAFKRPDLPAIQRNKNADGE